MAAPGRLPPAGCAFSSPARPPRGAGSLNAYVPTVQAACIGALLATLASLCGQVLAADGYTGSTFAEVQAAVWRQPYATLPRWPVDSHTLGETGDSPDNHLRAAAIRTLKDRSDLREFRRDRKLFQASGICFAGEWRIDTATPWTGLFAEGTRALLIMRASVSLGETQRGAKRAFALAGKIFPTLDPQQRVHTANFFAMENALGTDDDHFLDAVMDNNPVVKGLPGSFGQLLLGLRIREDLNAADRTAGARSPDPTYRPLYPLSESGLTDKAVARTPRWLQLRAAEGTPRIDAADFRDELRLGNYPGQRLRFELSAAPDHPDGKGSARWQRVGSALLTQDVTSPGCDGRLHFSHPVLR